MRWALIQPYWCVYERLGYRQVQSKGHVETQGADAVCRSRREALGGTHPAHAGTSGSGLRGVGNKALFCEPPAQRPPAVPLDKVTHRCAPPGVPGYGRLWHMAPRGAWAGGTDGGLTPPGVTYKTRRRNSPGKRRQTGRRQAVDEAQGRMG